MATVKPCDRQPDKVRNLDGGFILHTYLDVPKTDAAPLVFCHHDDKNPDFWDQDFSVGSTPDVCTVLIYYKQQ